MISRHIYAAHEYADNDFYQKPDPKTAMQDVSMAKMTGVLKQLGNLAVYSSHIFDGVFQMAKETDERLDGVSRKVVGLQQDVTAEPRLESLAAGGKGPKYYKDIQEPKMEGREFELVRNLFVTTSRPKHVQAQYKRTCTPPPDFTALDEFQTDGRPCVARFSDPQFFFREW